MFDNLSAAFMDQGLMNLVIVYVALSDLSQNPKNRNQHSYIMILHEYGKSPAKEVLTR